MISEGFDHRVVISLRHRDFWDVDGGIQEIRNIMDWIHELVEWQENMYQVKMRSTSRCMDVWFCHEHHAVACALKWCQ